jgi:hypothetical protein
MRRFWWAGLIIFTALAVGCITPKLHPTPLANASLTDLLSKVTVAPITTKPGYQRGCAAHQACVFGPSWKDPADHSGCSTRDRVLARDLHDVQTRPAPGRGRCRAHVIGGWLDDPYTGVRIDFTLLHPEAIQIDHIYPEHRAWNAGANTWPLPKRQAFANDVANLLAVSGKANEAKGDRGPGRWLPANRPFDCAYVTTYVRVALSYGLPIDPSDKDAAIKACPAN